MKDNMSRMVIFMAGFGQLISWHMLFASPDERLQQLQTSDEIFKQCLVILIRAMCKTPFPTLRKREVLVTGAEEIGAFQMSVWTVLARAKLPL
eukprot:868418-Pelagomonas_calceolata.AAC.1